MFNSTTVYQESGTPDILDQISGTPGAITSCAGAGAAPLGTIGKLRTGLDESSALQSAERRYLRYSLQAAARELLPREMVAKCLRLPIPSAATVDIYRNPEFCRASLGGLQVCASV